MRLIKFLSAVLAAAVGRIRSTPITDKEFVVGKLLSTTEGRLKLAAAMIKPRRCGGLEYQDDPGLDVGKVRVGDKVVFANPKSGLDCDIALSRAARLRVGQEYTVTKVNLGAWRCTLWLEGWSCDFNSVQFDSPAKVRLTPHQTAVKAEVDGFLDAGAPGIRIIDFMTPFAP